MGAGAVAGVLDAVVYFLVFVAGATFIEAGVDTRRPHRMLFVVGCGLVAVVAVRALLVFSVL